MSVYKLISNHYMLYIQLQNSTQFQQTDNIIISTNTLCVLMVVEKLSYDLRPWSTNSLYDLVVDLRSMTQINQFAMCFERLSYNLQPRSTNTLRVLSGWDTIYDTDHPIRCVFWKIDLRSTTQIIKYAKCFELLSYELWSRSTILYDIWMVMTHVNQFFSCYELWPR